MTQLKLTPEDLLTGADAAYDVSIPAEVLHPGGGDGSNGHEKVVQLRPLNIGTFQLILKAAKDDPGMIPLLMIKESLVEPQMSLPQIKKMHLGLVEFLLAHVRQISGLTEKKTL
ncbi:MAG: hypothetical protein H6577_05895 [Lewinellaceae bacterium]|nr:hypothetical protein [Saprospiraceae bacterium]MCB9337639.1 hypothetical protein [Lewinellaceae bacterium]